MSSAPSSTASAVLDSAATNPAIQAAVRLHLFRESFELFATHELKIQTKEGGSPIRPFLLRLFQQRLVAAMEAQRQSQGFVRQAWLKGRQVGSSTLSLAYVFWRTVLFDNVNSIVVAHDEGTAEKLFQMVQRFYDRLSPEIRPMVRYRTKGSIEFENPNAKDRLLRPGRNSRLTIATAKNIHSGAGGTYHCVVLSEAARYPHPEEIVSSTLQAVPSQSDTIIIVESTARPEGRWFYNLCLAAQSDEDANPYEYQFINWLDDPTCIIPVPDGGLLPAPLGDERRLIGMTPEEIHLVRQHHLSPEQLMFRRVKLAGDFMNDELLFGQEYPLDFNDAWVPRGLAVWPRDHLALLARGLAAPLFRADLGQDGRILRAQNGPLAVWSEPEPNVIYDIGVDTAMGQDGGDWSVAEVLRRDTQQQVAELRLRMEPTAFVDLVASLGYYYNTAQVNVEVNGASGYFVNARLTQSLDYPNLYLWRKHDYIVPRVSKFTGFETTHKTKRYIVSLGKDRVFRWSTSDVDHYPLIRSEQLHEEMRTFVRRDGYIESFGGAPGSHDDCVVAWLLALVSADDESFGLVMRRSETGDKPPTSWSNHEAFRMSDAEAGLRPSTGFWGNLDGWR
jgi:hypothetical protein